MTQPDTAQVIAKVRRLLALADEARNDNEYERATALRQANALMDRHGVQIAALEGDELGPRGRSSIVAGSAVWKATVLAGVAKLYGCEVYRTTGRDGEIFVIGRQHYRNVVLDMGRYVVDSIEREARRYQGSGRGRAFGNAFRKGAASGIHATVGDIVAQRAQGAIVAEPGQSMVLVDHYASEKQANRQWLAEQDITLRTQRSMISNRAAYDEGKAFGSGIGLSDQLGGGGVSGRPTAALPRSGK